MYAAVVATQLTDRSAHPWSLTINGLDVVKNPGTGGNTFGVPIESIDVTSAVPGAVSSMRFRIEDPASEVPLPSAGDWVLLWDNTNNKPAFRGWVMTPTVTVFGVGRAIDVVCQGVEALLDWAKTTADLTFTTTLDWIWYAHNIAQSLVYQAEGLPDNVRAFYTDPGSNYGSQSYPIANCEQLGTGASVTIPAGTSLRDAITAAVYATMASGAAGLPPNLSRVPMVSVDYWMGIRVWMGFPATPTNVPSDYATLTVTDTVGGTIRSEGLQHSVDGGGILRGVYVKGGNVAGTGLVTDGSGKPGRIEYLADSTILTQAARDSLAKGRIAASVAQVAGSFTLADWTPTADVVAASPLVLTDVQAGVSSTYRIAGITRMFNDSGRETWTVSYGVMPPSFVQRTSS